MNEDSNVFTALVGVLIIVVVFIVSIANSVDSLRNCSRSCDGKMLSYTEELKTGDNRRFPVCTCFEAPR